MSITALHSASLLLTWTGIAAICFQIPSQRERVGWPPQARSKRLTLQILGGLALALALGSALGADPLSFAIVTWICQAGLAALLLCLCLPFLGRHVIRLAQLLTLAGIAQLVLALKKF